jgi:hypothetical protein
MSVSDLLKETATIYKIRFKPLILLALVPQIPAFLLSFLPNAATISVTLVLFLFVLPLSALASGGSVITITQHYLEGHIHLGSSFRRAWYRILSLSVGHLVFGLCLIGAAALSSIIIGIPLLFYLLVIWYCFVPCIMLEGKGPLDSMWRSRDLVKGYYWRVLGICLIYTFILLVIAFIAVSVNYGLSNISTVLSSLVVATAGVIILPIGWIGQTLVYLDLRARKENYNMADLANDSSV